MRKRLPQIGRGVQDVGRDDDVVVAGREALGRRVALDVEQRAAHEGVAGELLRRTLAGTAATDR